METNTEIATTILSQLGASRFRIMTGARDFCALPDGLLFSLPGNMTKDRINRVKISLLPSDTYKVEFLRVWKNKVTLIHVSEDVYVDVLRDIFEKYTGLATSL
jgi:hypothetical protein